MKLKLSRCTVYKVVRIYKHGRTSYKSAFMDKLKYEKVYRLNRRANALKGTKLFVFKILSAAQDWMHTQVYMDRGPFAILSCIAYNVEEVNIPYNNTILQRVCDTFWANTTKIQVFGSTSCAFALTWPVNTLICDALTPLERIK